MSVVRVREGPFYKGFFLRKYVRILLGQRKLSVLEVSVRRGSTESLAFQLADRNPGQGRHGWRSGAQRHLAEAAILVAMETLDYKVEYKMK